MGYAQTFNPNLGGLFQCVSENYYYRANVIETIRVRQWIFTVNDSIKKKELPYKHSEFEIYHGAISNDGTLFIVAGYKSKNFSRSLFKYDFRTDSLTHLFSFENDSIILNNSAHLTIDNENKKVIFGGTWVSMGFNMAFKDGGHDFSENALKRGAEGMFIYEFDWNQNKIVFERRVSFSWNLMVDWMQKQCNDKAAWSCGIMPDKIVKFGNSAFCLLGHNYLAYATGGGGGGFSQVKTGVDKHGYNTYITMPSTIKSGTGGGKAQGQSIGDILDTPKGERCFTNKETPTHENWERDIFCILVDSLGSVSHKVLPRYEANSAPYFVSVGADQVNVKYIYSSSGLTKKRMEKLNAQGIETKKYYSVKIIPSSIIIEGTD